MHTELSNLLLFARVIAKLSLTTGFGFWLAGMAAIHFGRKYHISAAVMRVGRRRLVWANTFRVQPSLSRPGASDARSRRSIA
jgi:hypothetical protein